jgi:hypothetical protein
VERALLPAAFDFDSDSTGHEVRAITSESRGAEKGQQSVFSVSVVRAL